MEVLQADTSWNKLEGILNDELRQDGIKDGSTIEAVNNNFNIYASLAANVMQENGFQKDVKRKLADEIRILSELLNEKE